MIIMMNYGNVQFEVELNMETDCNVARICGWPYGNEELALAVEWLECEVGVSVEL